MYATPGAETTNPDRPVWVAPRLKRLSSESIQNANGIQNDLGENQSFGGS
jgi:hypothetical protein